MSGDAARTVTVDCTAFGAGYATLDHARADAQLDPAIVAKLMQGHHLAPMELQAAVRFVGLQCLVPESAYDESGHPDGERSR